MSGFIKIYRGWDQCAAFKPTDPYCQRAAWVWLLDKAAWKNTHRRDPHGNIVPVARGQLHTSARTLGAAWGWSKNKAERFLRDLEKCEMVDRKTDQHGVLITICNYDKYQGERTTDGPRSGPVSDQSRTTQEEGKERKERKNTALARPDDVPADLWADFLTVRKAHKAPMTENALAGLRREADKAGWPLRDAINLCVTNGWRGFQAHYVKGRTPHGADADPEYLGP